MSGADFTFVLAEFQKISVRLVFKADEDHLNGCLVLQHNDLQHQFNVMPKLAEEPFCSGIQVAGGDRPRRCHLRNAICKCQLNA